MGNTIDYPVNHTLSSNTRHVVDALQIGMIASTLKNERTFNDLQFFVDRTAANYNQYYNRRCMLNARNEKTQRTRGIIVDLAATPRFRELPLCIEKWTGLRQRIPLSTGEIAVISRLDDEEGMHSRTYKVHVALVGDPKNEVKWYNIMELSMPSDFRCFPMGNDRMMIIVTKHRTIMTPSTFFLHTYTFGDEQTVFYTDVKVNMWYDCPIIHVSGERFIFVKSSCEGEEWNGGRLIPRVILSKESTASRGTEKRMFGAQTAPTKFLMFTTYNHSHNTIMYVDLLDIPTWTWQTIHTFSDEIMERLICY
jgi:hypothetical protein